jgi:alginate O-acetyltransferase complex protein AlgI
MLTYLLVNITWVFFRAETFEGAARILRGMAGLAAEPAAVLPTVYMIKVAVIIASMVTIQWLMRKRSLEDLVARTPWWLTGFVAAAMLFAVITTQGSGEAFIYFQF